MAADESTDSPHAHVYAVAHIDNVHHFKMEHLTAHLSTAYEEKK
ncbi:hypothetical protein [Nocardia rhamnosiphila]|uniref:Uncharacterized protein n=1 Tax=Nocardia rhamnosiphila TaxID=426716 RepID=A0ABV2WRB7_9NOCA